MTCDVCCALPGQREPKTRRSGRSSTTPWWSTSQGSTNWFSIHRRWRTVSQTTTIEFNSHVYGASMIIDFGPDAYWTPTEPNMIHGWSMSNYNTYQPSMCVSRVYFFDLCCYGVATIDHNAYDIVTTALFIHVPSGWRFRYRCRRKSVRRYCFDAYAIARKHELEACGQLRLLSFGCHTRQRP